MQLHRLGREVLGPAFCHFVRAVIARSEALGLDRLYFLAREGWLLEKLYELLAPRPLPHRYLHVSRRSTALAAVQGFGPREAALAVSGAGLLELFGLDDAELRALAAPHTDAARLVADENFRAAAAPRAAAARERLAAYLAAQDFFAGGAAGLVDVGWRGTIQDHLGRAFAGRAGLPSLRGLYLACYAPGADREGVLFDGRAGGFAEEAPLHFVQIFEDAARGPDGTTLGYAPANGVMAPVLKEAGPDRDSERAGATAVAELQAGVLDCARLDPPRPRADVRRALARFIFSPTRAERLALASLTHADDWLRHGHGSVLPPGGPALLARPRVWIARFHEARWKPGFVAQTGGAPLAWLYRNYERLKSFRGRTG